MTAHDQIVKELKDILPGTWEYESDSPHLKGTTFGQGRSKERQVYPGICVRWDKIHADGILFTHPSNASSLEITYCAQGRVGWDMHQRSIYLGQGDLAIHPMDCCSESKMNFPSGYYKGITVEFDFEQMDFRRDGRGVELSKTEQKLLRVLVENRGHTVPRATLVDRVWTDGAEFVEENALSVTVKRLRSKLEADPAKPDYLKTVYGIGYTWAVEP